MGTFAADHTFSENYSRPLDIIDRRPTALNIFQRLSGGDASAINDCLRVYGNIVWEFAIDHTPSFREAEILSREIFQDIWDYDTDRNNTSEPEELLVRHIAIRRLYKHKWDSRHAALGQPA